jgi:histidine ammonia-lyase
VSRQNPQTAVYSKNIEKPALLSKVRATSMSKTNKILIGENRLTIDALVEIARGGKKIELDETALKKITRCRSFLDKKLQLGTEIYGVNTGLGGTSHLHISEDVITEMQNWQIRSH